MEYRRFPRIPDAKISTLGLGCMRLPTTSGDPASIDRSAFEEMLIAAADAGINYLDTAYVYHRGMSESVLGEALLDTGLRNRFSLATKCPTWLVKAKGDWDRYLDEQLARLGTGQVDFYLFHALSRERWDMVRRLGGIEAMENAVADGRIRHLGFSFHDSHKTFVDIVEGYDRWDFCQLQYNYVDRDFQAGEAGLELAASKGIGVVVMEPLRGGALADPPEAVRNAFAALDVPRSPVEWALRFVLDRQEVVAALSGMGSVSQIWENAAIASSARPNSLLRAEHEALDEARRIFKTRERVPCTTCGYCLPCPAGIDIPGVFSQYNGASMFGNLPATAAWYETAFVRAGKGADNCTSCGLCLPKCPQRIEIPKSLAEAHSYLPSGN